MRALVVLLSLSLPLVAAAADRDGDGYDEAVDCDDADPAINPGAHEADVADGIDQDCSGMADDASVCADGGLFGTVQEGVDVVPDGFTLVLCAGTYTENVSIGGRIGLMSTEGAVIDAGGSGTALAVTAGADVTVDGVTFSGATTSGITCASADLALYNTDVSGNTATDGAGVRADRCALDIRDSSIHDNLATSRGGGLFATDCSGALSDSTLSDNEAFAGGGAHMTNGSVTITGNEFSDNTANTDERYNGGGGLFIQADVDVLGNSFLRNHSGYDGGGFYAKYADGRWAQNTIGENTCVFDGAGGYFDQADATFEDNVIENNAASDDAGGIRVYVSGMVLQDNLFRFNTAGDDGGGLKLSHSANTVQRNDFMGNSAGDAGGGLEFDNESGGLFDSRFYQNHARRGGGMHYWRNEADVDLERNEFVENTASSCGAAIQIDNASHLVTIHKTLFRDNSSDDDGGAVCIELHYQDDDLSVFEESNLLVTNSLFQGNSAVDDGSVFYVNTGTVTVGNIMVDGASGEDGAVTADDGHANIVNSVFQGITGGRTMYAKNGGTLTLQYNDFWDYEGTFDGIDDPIGVDGNLAEDPRFRAGGRYRLRPDSPLVDAGDPSKSDVDGSRSDMGVRGGPGGW